MTTIQDRIKAETAKAVKGAGATVAETLARLEAENKALREAAARKTTISFKVAAKGGVSVYGLGRFPVTLYAGQWERLIAEGANLTAFMVAHAAELSVKP